MRMDIGINMRRNIKNTFKRNIKRILSCGLVLNIVFTSVGVLSGCGELGGANDVPEYVLVYAENQSENYPRWSQTNIHRISYARIRWLFSTSDLTCAWL